MFLRFALEPQSALGIVEPMRRKDLDRDVASEFGVARPIHFPHAAHAEQACYFVGADERPARQVHVGSFIRTPAGSIRSIATPGAACVHGGGS